MDDSKYNAIEEAIASLELILVDFENKDFNEITERLTQYKLAASLARKAIDSF